MNEEQITLYVKEAEKMTLVQLLIARAGWIPSAAAWQVVDREIARRDALGTEARAWCALVLSVVSLIVAVYAFIE